jgi:cytochrome c-type biogenesis protein CcmH/NrfG
MSAFAIGCVVFAAGCFAALLMRLAGMGRRGSLADVLLPLLAASLAGGAYAWYAGSHVASETQVNLADAPPGHGTGELQDLASQLRGKLGANSTPAEIPARRNAGDLNELARQLAEKLKRDPGNGQGWALLARSYVNLQQFADAEQAFEKAAKILPRDAALYADWAEARVMAQGLKWDKRSMELLGQALAADPKNPKALSLAASEASARGDTRKSTAPK